MTYGSFCYWDMPDLKGLGLDGLTVLPTVYEATDNGSRGTNQPNFTLKCLGPKRADGMYDFFCDPMAVAQTCAAIRKAYPGAVEIELDIELGFQGPPGIDTMQRRATLETICQCFRSGGLDVWTYGADFMARGPSAWESITEAGAVILSAYPWTNDPREYARIIAARTAHLHKINPWRVAVEVWPHWGDNFVNQPHGAYVGDVMWNQQLACAEAWGDDTIVWVGEGGANGMRKWSEDGAHEWVKPLADFLKNPQPLLL